MSLNYEIQQLLAGFNTPPPIAEQIAGMVADIEREQLAPGLELDEVAPEFALPDASGRIVRLSERLAHGPVVVTFFRGAWCAACNLQVAALLRAMPEIRAAGASLIGVHPDSQTFATEQGHDDFPLLSDADQSVIRSYRLQFTVPAAVRRIYLGEFDIDISSRNSDGSWNLPVPGTFVLDPAGRVRRRHVTADFTRRMEPEDVVAALEELHAAAAGR